MDEPMTEERRRSRGHQAEKETSGKRTTDKERKKKPKKKEYSPQEKKNRRCRQVWIQRIVVALVLLTVVLGAVICLKILLAPKIPGNLEGGIFSAGELNIDVQLLTVNEYSRPGIPTDKIRGVVVHYTANPGSSAQNNRDYFESLKDSHQTKVSSNFIVGLEGEIIQCIPTSEMAYASNNRNRDTVSIECCHPDETGKFNDATYDSLVKLTSFLCQKFGLEKEDIIRHYDVTGKICPKYFVDNEEAWETFKDDVERSVLEKES